LSGDKEIVEEKGSRGVGYERGVLVVRLLVFKGWVKENGREGVGGSRGRVGEESRMRFGGRMGGDAGAVI